MPSIATASLVVSILVALGAGPVPAPLQPNGPGQAGTLTVGSLLQDSLRA